MKNNMKSVKAKICMGICYACLFIVLLFFMSGCSNQKNSQEDNTQRKEPAGQDAEFG